MATLSSNSTDAEVWAAYGDNASYEGDGSRAKASAFITACRILRNRLPLFAGRGPQSVTRESLDAEISAARAWLDAHPEANPNLEIRKKLEIRSPNVQNGVAAGAADCVFVICVFHLARQGRDLTWRDILTWPMPEGVQVSVQQRGAATGKSRSKPASRPAARANEPNGESESDDDDWTPEK